MTTHPEARHKSLKAPQPPVVSYYLIVYNLCSALGWSYVFFTVSAHLSGFTSLSRNVPAPGLSTATSALMRILNSIPYFKSSVPLSTQLKARMPPALVPLFNRASTTYVAVGPQTALVQSFAVLEVIHSWLRWVRSPVITTAMQVASRLVLVWAIAEKYDSARSNPLYASMVVAWSIAEIIRYSFYALNLLQYEPRWLLWLRYNTFFVLYPLGAGSEAALIFSTLPSSFPPTPGSWTYNAWRGWDYCRATIFLLWWPGLYVMYTYMIKQRRKIFGSTTIGEPMKRKVT